jgi:hypothetical protein
MAGQTQYCRPDNPNTVGWSRLVKQPDKPNTVGQTNGRTNAIQYSITVLQYNTVFFCPVYSMAFFKWTVCPAYSIAFVRPTVLRLSVCP